MAQGKKSFIAYSDWQGMFNALPDDVAGRLIKHIFSYVNDENPSSEDYIINALFEPIKSTLKRDLVKWETQQEQRKNAGIKSAEVRKQNATKFNERSISSTDSVSVSVNVNESDNVNDNVNDIILFQKKFNFKNSLLELNSNPQLVNDWLQIRKTKKATNSESAFALFLNEVQKSNLEINEVLKICIEKDWKGFKAEWVQNIKQLNNKQNDNRKPTIDNAIDYLNRGSVAEFVKE